MTDQLRRLLGELAEEAPDSVDPAVVRRSAARRRATGAMAAAAAVVAASAVAAAVLQPADRPDSLGPAEGEPTPVASSTSSPTASPTPAPVRSLPPAGPRPEVVYAAMGSRVASYRVADGTRTAWLSPEASGFGTGDLALSEDAVLYGLGNGETRRVLTVDRAPGDRPLDPAILTDPGAFYPAVLPDGSRYALLLTGNDSAYTSPDPGDLRLVLTEESGGTQAVAAEASATVHGLAFAAPDRVVLATTHDRGDPTVMGLRVYDFQTDEAPLGSRAPDERFLPPPTGCSWRLPTATPVPDEVLVLQRCEDGGAFDAVVVDTTSGRVVQEFGAVLPNGPGQVDSLDLDATGRHLVAQVHDGSSPLPPGSPDTDTGPVFTTRTLAGGSTVTTTTSLVWPVWD